MAALIVVTIAMAQLHQQQQQQLYKRDNTVGAVLRLYQRIKDDATIHRGTFTS